MDHELKILPRFYEAVASGVKTFEFRDNGDRGFQCGDTVYLREWDPKLAEKLQSEDGGYTKNAVLIFRIGYVLPVGLKVVFSLLPVDRSINE